MTPVKSNSVFLTVLTKISCTSGIKNFSCQYLKNSFTWLQLQLRGYEKWLWNITFFESAKDTIYRRFSLRSLTSCGQKFSIFAFIVRLFAQHGSTLRVIINFCAYTFLVCNFISTFLGEKIIPSEKYIMEEVPKNEYSLQMNLRIRNIERKDIGGYTCTSSNALGKAEGTVRLQGKFKNSKHYCLVCFYSSETSWKFCFYNWRIMFPTSNMSTDSSNLRI